MMLNDNSPMYWKVRDLTSHKYLIDTILNGLDDEAHVGFTLCNYMRGIVKLAEEAEALKHGS